MSETTGKIGRPALPKKEKRWKFISTRLPRVALARNGALADPGLIAFTLAGFLFSGYRRAWCRR